MKTWIPKTAFTVMLLISYLLLHETTHEAIDQMYGCDNITQGINYVTSTCYDENVKLPNAINEIVGYNIMPMLLLIITIMIWRTE